MSTTTIRIVTESEEFEDEPETPEEGNETVEDENNETLPEVPDENNETQEGNETQESSPSAFTGLMEDSLNQS